MCVHVFGGTSFPCCCNYARRKAAVINASEFKVGVAEPSMNNFYIDGFFKSVESENSYKIVGESGNKWCQLN